ncbi:MAG TPA: hypothetical protein EYP39_09020 [Ghiorsea sp.]|nr:hypothetical protein [Ghiorsea sp.]
MKREYYNDDTEYYNEDNSVDYNDDYNDDYNRPEPQQSKSEPQQSQSQSEQTVSRFVRGTQVYALIIVTVLIAVDKGLGLMVTSPSEIYYAVLGAYGLGGTGLVKAIEKFRKF